MTKEYQEATNEFLKVRFLNSPRTSHSRQPLTSTLPTEPKLRPVDRSLVRGLLGQGPRAIPLGEGINKTRFLLSIDATCYTGDCSCRASLEKKARGGGRPGRAGADIGWCKYCTTLTMRYRFLATQSAHGQTLNVGLSVVLCVHAKHQGAHDDTSASTSDSG